jgi:hypothetical protein
MGQALLRDTVILMMRPGPSYVLQLGTRGSTILIRSDTFPILL